MANYLFFEIVSILKTQEFQSIPNMICKAAPSAKVKKAFLKKLKQLGFVADENGTLRFRNHPIGGDSNYYEEVYVHTKENCEDCGFGKGKACVTLGYIDGYHK